MKNWGNFYFLFFPFLLFLQKSDFQKWSVQNGPESGIYDLGLRQGLQNPQISYKQILINYFIIKFIK